MVLNALRLYSLNKSTAFISSAPFATCSPLSKSSFSCAQCLRDRNFASIASIRRSPLILPPKFSLRTSATSCGDHSHSHSESHSHSHNHNHTHGHAKEAPSAATKSSCSDSNAIKSSDAHSDACNHGHQHTSVSSCCASVKPPPGLALGPLRVPLEKYLDLKQSLIATISSGVCVLTGAIMRYIGVNAMFTNGVLFIPIFLTLIPTLLSSCFHLWRTKFRGLDVGVLMTVASTICVCSGALIEGVLLATLFALSHAIERAINNHASKQLDDLKDVTPQFATRVTAQQNQVVPLEQVKVGDVLWVKAGEMVPCDGIVSPDSDGAFVSSPHLTGETIPRSVMPGDSVAAGARTVDAPLSIIVESIGADSSLARIEKLVAEAQATRPGFIGAFDKFSRIYARSVMGAALAIAVLFPIIPSISLTGNQGSLKRALGFLVVTSPCALVLGAPIAYIAALSKCARKGVLVKTGAKGIERTAKSDGVMFDKTGTLTSGKLAWVSCLKLDKVGGKWSELKGDELKHVIAVAASLERGAIHPVAETILGLAEELQVAFVKAEKVRTVAGQGVQGQFGKSVTKIGRKAFAVEDNERVSNFVSIQADEACANGETVSVMQHDGVYYLLRFRDEVRPDAKEAVAAILNNGHKVTVLTGDGKGAAKHVASVVGESSLTNIKNKLEVIYEATPEIKSQYIQNNHMAVMVGDGINDAPALAAANVGIACGLSSATAVHAADIVLVRPSPIEVSWFINHAKRTERIVAQNIALAGILMLAAAIPVVHGSLPLWLAVIMHEGGTILVALNGLRLLR